MPETDEGKIIRGEAGAEAASPELEESNRLLAQQTSLDQYPTTKKLVEQAFQATLPRQGKLIDQDPDGLRFAAPALTEYAGPANRYGADPIRSYQNFLCHEQVAKEIGYQRGLTSDSLQDLQNIENLPANFAQIEQIVAQIQEAEQLLKQKMLAAWLASQELADDYYHGHTGSFVGSEIFRERPEYVARLLSTTANHYLDEWAHRSPGLQGREHLYKLQEFTRRKKDLIGNIQSSLEQSQPLGTFLEQFPQVQPVLDAAQIVLAIVQDLNKAFDSNPKALLDKQVIENLTEARLQKTHDALAGVPYSSWTEVNIALKPDQDREKERTRIEQMEKANEKRLFLNDSCKKLLADHSLPDARTILQARLAELDIQERYFQELFAAKLDQEWAGWQAKQFLVVNKNFSSVLAKQERATEETQTLVEEAEVLRGPLKTLGDLSITPVAKQGRLEFLFQDQQTHTSQNLEQATNVQLQNTQKAIEALAQEVSALDQQRTAKEATLIRIKTLPLVGGLIKAVVGKGMEKEILGLVSAINEKKEELASARQKAKECLDAQKALSELEKMLRHEAATERLMGQPTDIASLLNNLCRAKEEQLRDQTHLSQIEKQLFAEYQNILEASKSAKKHYEIVKKSRKTSQ